MTMQQFREYVQMCVRQSDSDDKAEAIMAVRLLASMVLAQQYAAGALSK